MKRYTDVFYASLRYKLGVSVLQGGATLSQAYRFLDRPHLAGLRSLANIIFRLIGLCFVSHMIGVRFLPKFISHVIGLRPLGKT